MDREDDGKTLRSCTKSAMTPLQQTGGGHHLDRMANPIYPERADENHLLHSHKRGEIEDIEEDSAAAQPMILEYISGVYEKLGKAHLG